MKFILVLVPLIEVAFIIFLVNAIGSIPTFVLIGVSTGLGFLWESYLWKKSLPKIEYFFKDRTKPLPSNYSDEYWDMSAELLLHGAAAALFVTPGFITDIIGISMLTSNGRAVWKRWIIKNSKGKLKSKSPSPINQNG